MEPLNVSFIVPDWYDENNVVTTTELCDVQSQIRIFDNAASSEMGTNERRQSAPDVKAPQEINPATTKSKSDLAEDAISELRDVVAASMASLHGCALPHNQATVVLESDCEQYADHVFAVLVRLAKDISANIVHFDLEDLEDVAEDFQRQQEQMTSATSATRGTGDESRASDGTPKGTASGEEGDPSEEVGIHPMSSDRSTSRDSKRGSSDYSSDGDISSPSSTESRYGLTETYFGSHSHGNTSQGFRSRNEMAVRAILNASGRKRPDHASSHINGNDERPHDAREVPLLVLLKDTLAAIDRSSQQSLVAGILDQVEKQRQAGRKIVLFTAPIDTAPGRDRLIRLNRVDIASTVKIRHSHCDASNSNASSTFIRRLKRALRREACVIAQPLTLCAYPQWPIEDVRVVDECRTESALDTEDFRRAVRQVCGRIIGKPSIEVSDILDVLRRISRQWQADRGNSDTERRSDVDDDESKTRDDAEYNEYEQQLVKCKVDAAKIDVTFEDVILDQKTLDSTKRLLQLFRLKAEGSSEKLLQYLQVTGALFHGPPGTGKTQLARAVAKCMGANMLAIEAADINDKYSGESEQLVRAAFTLASKLSPCVLFIDEVDALFYRRSAEDRQWERSQLTQFLIEMDGLVSNAQKPFVIAATNRLDDLDKALIRRLPHAVKFPLPDLSARMRLFRLHLDSDDIDSTVDVSALARATDGLTGSGIRDICSEAVLAWATEQTIGTDSTEITGKLSLSSRHFDSALLDVKLGGRESSIPEARSFFNGVLTDLQRRYPQSHHESMEDLKRQAKVNLEKGSDPEG